MPDYSRHIEASFQTWFLSQSFVGSTAIERQTPLRFDPDNPNITTWAHAFVDSIDEVQTRSAEWVGDITIRCVVSVRTQTDQYAKHRLMDEITGAMRGLVMRVLDYDQDETNGVDIGYVRFQSPQTIAGSVDRGTRQEASFTITGRAYLEV